jgi:hypothetical protein
MNYMKKYNQFATTIVIMVMVSMSSCFRPMFKTNTGGEVQAAQLNQLIEAKKFFILHSPDGAFALDSVVIYDDTLKAHAVTVWGIHRQYLDPQIDRANFYHVNQGSVVLNEVHIYASSKPDSGYHINLPIDQIIRMDVYEKDKAATTGARIGSTIAIAAGVTLVAILVKSAVEAVFDPLLGQ